MDYSRVHLKTNIFYIIFNNLGNNEILKNEFINKRKFNIVIGKIESQQSLIKK